MPVKMIPSELNKKKEIVILRKPGSEPVKCMILFLSCSKLVKIGKLGYM
jgi:hypothetical protein